MKPEASKTTVRTSDSLPSGGTSWPLKRKLTPAALPTLTVIWREARTDVCAGAMSVSWVTSWPSARTETQEFSEARMTRVKELEPLSADADLGGDLSKLRTVTSPDSVTFAAGAAGFAAGLEGTAVDGRGVDCAGAGGEDTAACAAGGTLLVGAGAGFVGGGAGAVTGDDVGTCAAAEGGAG